MRTRISLLIVLSAALSLLGGCGQQNTDSAYVLKPATPPGAEDLARLMKQDAAFWASQPSCLPGYVWPVRVNLTQVRDRGYDTYNKEVMPDLRLLRALETVGLAKSTVLTEKDTAYGTPVMTYALSYALTEAAQPWVKSLPAPGGEAGKPETLQMLCFGKPVPTNPQNPAMVIGDKKQTASAWQTADSPDTRAYLRYTLAPQPAFSEIEIALRKAAHIPSTLAPAEQRKIETAYKVIDKVAGIEAQTSVVKLWRKGQGPWQIYGQSLQTQEDWQNWPLEEVSPH